MPKGSPKGRTKNTNTKDDAHVADSTQVYPLHTNFFTATSVRPPSSNPSFAAVSSGKIHSPSTVKRATIMKRPCEVCKPKRLRYASINFLSGVDFLIS